MNNEEPRLDFLPFNKFQYTPPTPKPFVIYRCELGLYFDLRLFFDRIGVSRRSVSEWAERFKKVYPEDTRTFIQLVDGGTWYCNLESLDRVLVSQPKSGRAARFALERLHEEWKTSATRAKYLQDQTKTNAPLVALIEEADEAIAAPAIERDEPRPLNTNAGAVKTNAAPAAASFTIPNVPDVNFTV